MDIEIALNYLGFSQDRDFPKSNYYILYKKEGTRLFVYHSASLNARCFSSVSGEFHGTVDDLIRYYYLSYQSGSLRENNRLALFYEKNEVVENRDKKELIPLKYFNLYQVMMLERNVERHSDTDLRNAFEDKKNHYFFFLDDERIPGVAYNILGMVALSKNDKKEVEFPFSDLRRSVYFTDGMEGAKKSVLFDSFGEMLAFKKKVKERYLYSVIKGSYNKVKAIALDLIYSGKGIKERYLAFPDNLEGLKKDLYHLGVFADFEIKDKAGHYKVILKTSVLNDKFKDELFRLSVVVNKGAAKNNAMGKIFMVYNESERLGHARTVIEIPKIANVLKAVLFLMERHLLKDYLLYNIIKPTSRMVKWANTNKDYDKIDRTFKLSAQNSIREIYAYR